MAVEKGNWMISRRKFAGQHLSQREREREIEREREQMTIDQCTPRYRFCLPVFTREWLHLEVRSPKSSYAICGMRLLLFALGCQASMHNGLSTALQLGTNTCFLVYHDPASVLQYRVLDSNWQLILESRNS